MEKLIDKYETTGVFSVLKLGKSGRTSKDRILTITDNGVSYYRVFKDNKEKDFKMFFIRYKFLENMISSFSSNSKYGHGVEDKDFLELSKEYLLIKDKTESFLKDSITLDNIEYQIITEPKQNPRKYMFCVILRSKATNKGKEAEASYFEKMNLNKGDQSKNSGDVKRPWVLEFRNQNYFEKFKSILDLIKKRKLLAKRESDHQNEEEADKKHDKKNYDKKKEKNVLNKDNNPDMKDSEQEPELIQQIYFMEMAYQYLIKQYFNISNLIKIEKSDKVNNNNPSKLNNFQKQQAKLRLETAILNINYKFKEICQIFVKRIVHDLSSKPFTNGKSVFYLIPMVFPVPSTLKTPSNALFLYYIVGINFQLTWHQVSLKIKDNKSEGDYTVLKGAWNYLKTEFKNRDFANEVFLRLNSNINNTKLDSIRIPLTCIIDYLGFRILCESDIYIDDGGMACSSKRIENINDSESAFNKEISLMFSKEKQSGVTIETLLPVNLSNKDKKEGKSSAFGNYLKHLYKGFKDLDSMIFNEVIVKTLLLDDIKDYKKQIESNQDNDSEHSNKNKIDEKETTIKIEIFEEDKENKLVSEEKISELINYKDKGYEYFDYFNQSYSLKDIFKEPIRYLMDIKALIEIPKEKVDLLNKKVEIAKKPTYFKPEYIFKYLNENYQNDINDIDDNSKLIAYLKKMRQYLLLDKEGYTVSIQQISNLYKNFKENHINYFINLLDSMYFKPYNYFSLKAIMSNYGINSYYLGYIAEMTNAPHIRELCLIEMIASACKKIIFDMIAQKTMEKAYEDIYTGQNENKHPIEFDINSINDKYLENVPVSFYLKYNKTYLKKIHQLSSDFNRHYLNESKEKKSNTKGLYRFYWPQCDKYNSSEKELRKILIGSKQDKQQGNQSIKYENNKNTDLEQLTEAKREIIAFMRALFNFTLEKNEKWDVEINRIKYKNTALWKFILFDNVKHSYNITSDDLFKLCNPTYMSMPALFNSIQDHTGIIFNINLIVNTRFQQNEVVNREFTEDMIVEIRPITRLFGYRCFELCKNENKSYCVDFKLLYNEEMFNVVLKRYLKSRVLRETNDYFAFMMHYNCYLRRLENNDIRLKDNTLEYIMRFTPDIKDKLAYYNYDYCKAFFQNNSTKFISVLFLLLGIIDSISFNKEDEKQVIFTGVSKNIKHVEDYKMVIEYIKDYWFYKHPFLIIVNMLFARVYIRTKLMFNEMVELYYKEALQIANDSLGSDSSIFVASLCEEISQFYLAVDNYYEAMKLLLQAHKFYSLYTEDLFYCYIKNLKRIVKYLIVLGNYKEALIRGQEFIENYQLYSKKLSPDCNFNIEGILLNIINIAEELESWQLGVEMCKILLFDILKVSTDNRIITIKGYRDYRERHKSKVYQSMSTINQNQANSPNQVINNNNDYEEIKLDYLISLYLKLAVKNLTGINRDVFIKYIIKISENISIEKSNIDIIEESSINNDLLIKTVKEIREEGDVSAYLTKILNVLSIKNDQNKIFRNRLEAPLTSLDIDFKAAYDKLCNLYKVFNEKKDIFVIFKNYN